MCLNKTQFLSLILKLKSRKTRKLFQEFLIWVGFFNWGNWEFPRFPGFRFWFLYWNRKLRKLFQKIFSRLLNLSGFLLCEKIGNFRGLRVFDFGPYTEIENSENSEIFSSHVIVSLKEIGNFWGFRVLDLVLILKLKTLETWKLFQDV